MNGTLYITVAFVVCFFMWKKHGHKTEDRSQWDTILETTAFWNIALTTLFWPIAIPMKLAWTLLDKIYNQFTKNR